MAELCRKYNLHPRTVYIWREKFVENGKAGFAAGRRADPVVSVKKENEDLKRIVGEQTLVIDTFKKTLEG